MKTIFHPGLTTDKLNLFFRNSLVENLGIEITAIHPGLVDTGIFRSATGPWKLVKMIMSLFFVPVEKPAALVCYLAFSDEAKGSSGYFFPSSMVAGLMVIGWSGPGSLTGLVMLGKPPGAAADSPVGPPGRAGKPRSGNDIARTWLS